MDDKTYFDNHIEILSIIKEQLNYIPDELMTWDGKDFDNARFVYLQWLKVTIMLESERWIKEMGKRNNWDDKYDV